MERPHVLLVDDDEDVRLMTRVNLGFDGFDVAEACDGAEGLAYARSHHVDVIVLDIMMPGRDGLSVLRELRSDAALAQVPVVLLTARADAAAERDGWNSGATAYLTKPFTVAALATTLRQLLAEGTHTARQAAVLRLDLAERLSARAERVEVRPG